jgi:hypothetical protein
MEPLIINFVIPAKAVRAQGLSPFWGLSLFIDGVRLRKGTVPQRGQSLLLAVKAVTPWLAKG